MYISKKSLLIEFFKNFYNVPFVFVFFALVTFFSFFSFIKCEAENPSEEIETETEKTKDAGNNPDLICGVHMECKHEPRLVYYCKPNTPEFFVRAECVNCGDGGDLVSIRPQLIELEIKQKRALESLEKKHQNGRIDPARAFRSSLHD